MLCSDCTICVTQFFLQHLQKYVGESERVLFLEHMFHVLAETPPDTAAPLVQDRLESFFEKTFGSKINLEAEKTKYNLLMQSYYTTVLLQIEASEDPLLEAIQFAMIGNYIDFGAMTSVDETVLQKTLETHNDYVIDSETLSAFRVDLSSAKKLVYLADNCGEIVLDKALIQTIRRLYPSIAVQLIVRGAPVINDVTVSDAEQIGFDNIAEIIGNGTSIAGTSLSLISTEARNAIDSADVILSKGLGNLETLWGCGKKIYYLFLCKCNRISTLFNRPLLSGMFVQERI